MGYESEDDKGINGFVRRETKETIFICGHGGSRDAVQPAPSEVSSTEFRVQSLY